SHDGSKPTFHVVGSPTIQAITFYIRMMRSRHSGYADCIHVGVEQERASSTCTSCYPNDVGAPRCRFVQFNFQTCTIKPLCYETCNILLTSAARYQVGVD